MSKYNRTDSTGSTDSGYNSNSGSVEDLSRIGKNQEVIAKVKKVIGLFQEDFNRSKAFISTRLAELATTDGVVHMDAENFKTVKKLYLESEGDFSVAATFAGIDKQIKKVLKETEEGGREDAEKLFAEFREKMGLFRQEMETTLSSSEGVESLVYKYHIHQLFFNNFILWNVDDDGTPKFIDADEKKEFNNKIVPFIETFPSELTRTLSLSGAALESDTVKKLTNEFREGMIDALAIDPTNKKIPILDRDKLTEENFKKIADRVNDFVARLGKQTFINELEKILEMGQRKKITSELLKQAFASIKKDQKFPTKQEEKVTGILSPVLEGMDYKYLENNKEALITEIKESVIGSRTFYSKFISSEIVVPSQKIEASSKRLSDKYNKWQDGSVVDAKLAQGTEKIKEKIENVKVDTQLRQPIVSQKETSIIREDIGVKPELEPASKQDSKPVEPSDIFIEIKQDLAPVVESGGTKPSDQPAIVIPEASTKLDPEYLQDPNPSKVICQSAVEYAFKKRNAKITPEESKKISDLLVSKLDKFDHEYLKEHEGSISNSLAAAFVEQGKVSFWRRHFTINEEKLQQIAVTLEENIIKSCEEELIKKLFVHQIGNTALASRVTEFLEQNKKRNIEFPYDPKKITNRQLVRMSHINRELFDKIIFPESKVSRKRETPIAPSKTPTNIPSTSKPSLMP